MRTRNTRFGFLPDFAHGVGACIVAIAWCHSACGDAPTGPELIESMKRSLAFPPDASMRLSVDSKGTWHNAPAAEGEAWSGTVRDRWQIMSDAGQYGRERHRDSPAGASKSRTVINESQRQVFEFDLDSPPDAAVAGRLYKRSQGFRDTTWYVPMVDYLDRVFVLSNRFSGNFGVIESTGEMASIDGHPCHEARGSWNGREFSFWLDPEYGFLPRQYTMRLNHANEESRGRRGGPGPSDQRILAPPELQGLLNRPITTEERLSGVVLERVDGFSYIARATLERTLTFRDGISHTEHLSMETTDFSLVANPDAGAFLAFGGLLRDGTAVEERTGGGRSSPEVVKTYVVQNGRLVPVRAGVGGYWSQAWHDVKVLAADFNMDNLKRLDSKLLIGACAVTALLINGGMACAAWRRKNAKSKVTTQ